MKITYAQLNNPAMLAGLKKVANHDGFQIQTAYKIAKLCSAIDKEIETGMALAQKISKKHPNAMTEAKAQAAFDADLREFLALEVSVQAEPISVDELQGVSLTPAEISAISPLFHQT